MSVRPIYITDGSEPVFGVLHPAAAPLRDLAVLLCPPFGWDEICSARARWDWAEHLAARGYPTLRFDLPGSGDSGGSPWSAGLLDLWTGAVGSAASALRSETGCRRVAAIGIGLGGIVTCTALAAGAPIDDLVLWSVPARGRSFVREVRAFSRLEASELPDPPADATGALPDDALAAGGFVLSAETLQALGDLDLSDLELPARRVLMLERDGRAVDERLRERFEAASAEVTVAPGDGYGPMVISWPQEAIPAVEVFERVGRWLDDSSPGEAAVLPRTEDEAPASVELTVGPVRIRETAIAVEQPFGKLLGVLSEPLREPAGICAVLLNAGSQRRIGPNRMWTDMARRWAARGVPTLRLDLAGIGDSEGDASRFADDEAFYVPEFVDQARAAVDVLEARGLAPRFVLGGLCSGAYWSLHSAIDDERVVAALLLNPRALTWDSTSSWVQARRSTRELRRKLVRASAWGRVLRGQASYSRPFRIAGQFLWQLAKTPLRLPGRIAARRRANAVGGDATDVLLDRLRDLGKRALLVFVGLEPLHEEYLRAGRMERLDRWPNIHLEVIELGFDTHTLRPVWLQREVHAMADRAIERELDLLGSTDPRELPSSLPDDIASGGTQPARRTT